MKARRIRAVSLALLALAALALWHFRAGPRPAAAPGRPPAAARPLRPPPHANPNPAFGGPPIEDAPSELVRDLNSPSGDIHADLRELNDLFAAYRSAVHGLNPVGDNVDITAVLTGRNPLGFAFIPKDCPAINANGELCDRWGTPFFFHQLAGDRMEIRSAGPDRRMYTADDEVLTP